MYDLPTPNPQDLKRTLALTARIRDEVARQHGVISFAAFMQLALYQPELGYYMAPTFHLGRQGDFTTAPEISPLFAQCFATQVQAILSRMNEGSLLEAGAGTGRFAGDLLITLEHLGCLPDAYYIYEISPHLRQVQRHHLTTVCPHLIERIRWVESLPQSFRGVIIANEVLDALPVHCFQVTESGIQERCVRFENEAFHWQFTPPTTPELLDIAERLQADYHLPLDYQFEVNIQQNAFIQALADALEKGVILLADYGYGQKEYYHPERRHGTLTCFYQHHRHADPLILPGLQDITTHVDFTRVIECAHDHGCELAGYTTQAAFLLACGLMERVALQEKTLSEAEALACHHAVKLLTFPTEMGERVKIMALAKGVDTPLMGFRMQDRRREL